MPFTNKIQNCLHVLRRNHRFRSLLSFWAATHLNEWMNENLYIAHKKLPHKTMRVHSARTFTVLPALSTLRQTHACSKSNTSTTKPMAFALSHTLAPHLKQSPTRHQALFYSLFFQKPAHFSSQNISVKPHCPSLLSVCTVCVCVCVCARL